MPTRFYEERRSYYKELIDRSIKIDGVQKSQFVMFQALSELRRIASVPESLTDGKIHSPELGALVESLLETVANGHKAVVFSISLPDSNCWEKRWKKTALIR